MIRYFLILLSFTCFLNAYAAEEKNLEDYHSYDPFRDKLLELRDNPPPKLAHNDKLIPKIIHQFWIGTNPLPDPYRFTVNSCKNLEGFEHKLWGNEEIETLLADSEEYRTTFNKIPSRDIAVRKDYLSYLALKKYGGAVLDTSMLCRKSLKGLHENYTHYFLFPYADRIYAYQTNSVNHVYLLGAGVIGAIKDSPVINDAIKGFSKFVDQYAEYNQKYTSSTFDYKNLWHGWVSQVLMNEALDKYCFVGQERCNDVHILTRAEYYYPFQDNSKEKALIVDIDGIPIAYIIKVFYNKAGDLDALIGLK